MPDGNWMSSDWLRKYIATSAPAVEPLRDSLDHPIVRRWFPGDTSDRFFQLWREHELYLDAMDKLPQTFCHFDLFRRNLFAKHSVEGCPQTIAIDWAYAGQGPIGADLLPLLLASIGFGKVGVDKLHMLDEIIFKGYLDGLRDVGWDGDPQEARLGYVTSGMRYNLSDIGSWLTLIHDESLHEDFEREIGRPIEDYFDYWGQISRPGYMLVEEARSIINKLG